MPDFKYSGCASSKNKRHFVSQKTFLFTYVGDKKERHEIVKELGSLFASQSFDPFELVSSEGGYVIHVLARHKNIRIPLHIVYYTRAVHTNLYYIGVCYGRLGSKFENERSKLEEILEKACKSVAEKAA